MMLPASAWLRFTWWGIFPAFALLAGAMSVERACGDPYRLLAGWMSAPALAWLLGVLYVGAHAWLAAAYLTIAARAGTLWPGRQFRATAGGELAKMIAIAGVIALDHVPVSLWAWLGRAAPVICRLS